jgi:hypothetical protein
MTQSATAELFVAPADPRPYEWGVREQMALTHEAVATAERASLHESIASVGWRRHGFLQRLVRAS